MLSSAAGRSKEYLCFSYKVVTGLLFLIKGYGYFCILAEYLAFKSI